MFYCLFQVHDIEFAQIETQVVQGLKAGNDSLKKLHEVSEFSSVLGCLNQFLNQ